MKISTTITRLTCKQVVFCRADFAVRTANYNRILWHILIYGCLVYNFHRYIFKYSHGGYPKEGYQQTPLTWQAAKFGLVFLAMSFIYLNTRFINRIPIRLVWLYTFLFFILLINITSILLYEQVITDEIEYLIFAFTLLPLCFTNFTDLKSIDKEIVSILNNSQYIIIISNWIVIANYFLLGVVPFHAYEGILMRFGGLWDDPNTLAIISAFLLGFSIFNKQYILAIFHIINILLAISFNGYLLMVVTVAYFFINTNNNRIIRLLLLGTLLIILSFIVFMNFSLFQPIYEAKSESIEQHSTLSVTFHWLPLSNAVQFHETWWISLFVNYFPLSIVFIFMCLWAFIKTYFFKSKSLQRLMFILFFMSNLSLPFLYMFPINFIAILFLVLYLKGIKF